jgi:adenylate cyclase
MSGRTSSFVARIADAADDTLELRLQKRVLVAVSAAVACAGLLWGAVYMAFGEPMAASIPWIYAGAVAASILLFAMTGQYRMFRFIQLALILLLPFMLQLALGGFVSGSAVIIWSLLAPLGALAMWGRQASVFWFLAYIALVLTAQLLQPALDTTNNLPGWLIAAFFVGNVLGASAVAFFALHYFVGQKDEAHALLRAEQDKSERLLLNVLPREIAAALKEDEQTIATRCDAVTVMFADVVGFTPIAERLTPEQVVELLNDAFSFFDSLASKYGLEKIRTMGDAYMVASGVPVARDDHAEAIARMALEMLTYESNGHLADADSLTLRIGISSGPVIAGVIGKAKFQYDVWGDTVNLASRMESHGVAGRIQVSPETYALIEDGFIWEARGLVDVKGKGPMQTWFLAGVAG